MNHANLAIQYEQIGTACGANDLSTKLTEKWAEQFFAQTQKKGRWERLVSWLQGRDSNLLYLHPATPVHQTSSQQRQSVPLTLIKGSCGGRTSDFDANFRPIHQHNRNRWLRVAMAMRMKRPLPPVELVKVDDHYFVVDGHHRLSVSKGFGLTEIDANVTEWQILPPS